MKAKPWQAAVAIALLILFVGFLGFRVLGPKAIPTFERTPAGPNPVEE